MKSEKRALQIWSVLVLSASSQRILSYKTLAKLTGLAIQGFAEPLGRVAQYCKSEGVPPLTVIVVTEETGMPGEGYPHHNEPLQIFEDQARVFVFDWLGREAPPADKFEKWRD